MNQLIPKGESLKLFLSLSFLIISCSVYSHSGRTDSYGCHTKHSTGEYHCHNPKAYKESIKPRGRQPASFKIRKMKK